MPNFPLTCLAVVAVLCGVYALIYSRSRNGNWHGTGQRMVRFKDGAWEYCDMTDAEADEEWQGRQW